MSNIRVTRAIGFGMIGSWAGTILMDVVMAGEFLMAGLPPDTLFAMFGEAFGGGVLLGVALHNFFGLFLGLVFGVIVLQVEALRINTARRGVELGILAGLATLPIACLPFASILGVTVTEMLAFSFIPHVVWGMVLGAVAGYGLRPVPSPR